MSDDTYASIDKQVQEIIKTVEENYPDSDTSLIQKAYELAREAHGSQKRRSGEPYIVHPVAVAYILSQYHMDSETIISALLHDVIEDTDYTFDDLKEQFGEDIAYMVESVSKMTRMNYQSKEESHAEYIRKMVLSMSNDIRIILIKLVDRLHNMRTLEYMSTAKQKEKSRETLDIYAPIANRLGIQSIRTELEDLAFKYLLPEEYEELKRNIKNRRLKGDYSLNHIIKQLEDILKDNGVEARVYGRIKHLYGIYHKMKTTNRNLDEIYDLFAVRIITKNVEDCYTVLGLIHTNFTALPNRMKDYIARPKANGYQSFHTTVLNASGSPFEIQIRSERMHEIDEYGIASHWKYKEGIDYTKEKDKRFEEGIGWIRQLIDWSDGFENASDFVELMKLDMLTDEVYVYTPNVDIIELPKGSTPIDFAYRIHTDVGNHMVGAKVNDHIVPLSYELQFGDIVTILTNKNSNGPSRDWLKYAKSSHARNKIKQYFKRIDREENIAAGKVIFEKEVSRLGDDVKEEVLKHANLELLAHSFNYQTIDDFYLSIGVTTLKTGTVIKRINVLFPYLFEKEKEEPVISEPSKKSKTNVLVSGQSGIETYLAQCCHPIPGDRIVGYINSNHGISVHRTDCTNIINLKNPDRLVDVQWTRNPDQKYSVSLFIQTFTMKGGFVDILKPFYDLNLPITSTSSKTVNDYDLYSINCEVESTRALSQLMNKIKNIPEVLRVYRN